MEDFNGLVTAKNNLMTSLGDKFTTYMKYMRKWFKMEYSKAQLDNRVNKMMTLQQIELHNILLVKFFKVCVGLIGRPTSHISFTDRQMQQDCRLQDSSIRASEGFIRVKINNSYDSGRCVLDEDLIYGRLTITAWENEMDGAEKDVARVLAIAAKNLIRNVLTAVMARRKGCKVRDNSFIHEIGAPIANPWFHSAPKVFGPRYWNDPYYYGLCSGATAKSSRKRKAGMYTSKFTATDLQQIKRERYEKLRRVQNEQDCVAASTSVNNTLSSPRQKVSLQELFKLLRVNRSLILSNLVYTKTMEKILGLINDDINE